MNAVPLTRQQKVERFKSIAARLDRLSVDWQRGPVADGEGILARLIKQQDPEPILTFDPFADRNDIEFVEHAPADERFLVALVRELDAEIRALKPKPKREVTVANRAGMLINDVDFQNWIFEIDEFEKAHDPIALKTHIRFKLKINSLNDLDTKEAARKAYSKLCGDFEKWNKQRRRR